MHDWREGRVEDFSLEYQGPSDRIEIWRTAMAIDGWLASSVNIVEWSRNPAGPLR